MINCTVNYFILIKLLLPTIVVLISAGIIEISSLALIILVSRESKTGGALQRCSSPFLTPLKPWTVSHAASLDAGWLHDSVTSPDVTWSSILFVNVWVDSVYQLHQLSFLKIRTLMHRSIDQKTDTLTTTSMTNSVVWSTNVTILFWCEWTVSIRALFRPEILKQKQRSM